MSEDGIGDRRGSASERETRGSARVSEVSRFLEGSPAFHPDHGVVDVLAVVGPQRLIRVQVGRSRSEIAVLAVHVDELSAVDRLV